MLEAHEYDDIKEWQEKLVGVAPPFLKDSIQNSIYDAALQSRINLPSEAVGIYFSKIRNRSNHVDFHLQDWPEEIKEISKQFKNLRINNSIKKITENKFKGYNVIIKDTQNKLIKPQHRLFEEIPSGLLLLSSEVPSDRFTIPIYPQLKVFGEYISDNGEFNYSPCVPPRNIVTSYLITKKVDGTPFQIGYDMEDFWIAGSEHQKIIFRSKRDLTYYKTRRRVSKEVEMAEEFFTRLEKAETIYQDLKHFLYLTRLTLNFTYQYPTQVTALPSKKSFVLTSLSGPQMELTTCSPALTLAVSKYFKIPSIIEEDIEFEPINNLSNATKELRKLWKNNAYVVHLLRSDLSLSSQVKVKPYWYIYLNLIFKVISTNLILPSDLEETKLELKLKLFGLYKGLPSESHPYQIFQKIGSEFIDWIVKITPPRSLYVYSQLPQLWEKFLEENNYPDDETILDLQVDPPIEQVYDEEFRSKLPLLVVFHGPIGIGKKFISENTIESLKEKEIKSIHISEEDFVKEKESERAFYLHVANTLKSMEYKVVIITTHTLNQILIDRFAQLSQIHYCKILFLAASERIKRNTELLLLSIASLISRKRKNNSEGVNEHFTDKISFNSLAALPFRHWQGISEHTHSLSISILNPEEVNKEEDTLLDTNEEEGIAYEDIKEDENEEIKTEEKKIVLNDQDSIYIPNEDELDELDVAKDILQLRFRKLPGNFTDRLFDSEIERLNLNDDQFIQSLTERRRPVQLVVNDMCHHIQTFMNIRYTPVSSKFICTPSIEAAARIFAITCNVAGNFPQRWRCSFDIQILRAWDNQPELWEKLSKLTGKQMKVTPVHLMITQKFWLLYVSLEVCETGEVIDDWFPNEKPFIFVAGEESYQSMDGKQIEKLTLFKSKMEILGKIPSFFATLQEADHKFWTNWSRIKIKDFLHEEFPLTPLITNTETINHNNNNNNNNDDSNVDDSK